MRRSFLVAVAAVLVGGSAVPAAAAAPTAGCVPWSVRTVATGLGGLENAVADGHGGLLLSNPGNGALLRLAPDGAVSTFATGLPDTGGIDRRGDQVYVSTGDSFQAGLLGTTDGTVVRFDLRTGARTVVATGLTGPNGLALLPDGSVVVTRTLSLVGPRSEVTRVAPDGTVQPLWSDLTSTNGAALDPTGRWLYVSRSLIPRAEVWRIDVRDPRHREKVADLGIGALTVLDDLTVTADGTVYGAAFAGGYVYRADPRTGATCRIATGLPVVTSVTPGDDGRLYVTSLAGTVYALSRH